VGTTFVYVTHDQEEALTMSDRLAVMSAGRVLQVGTPSEVYSRPASTQVATFLGTTNLFAASVVSVDGDRVGCEVDGTVLTAARGEYDAQVGAAVSLMVRPERVEVAPVGSPGADAAANLLDGKVAVLTFRGARTAVSLDCGGLTLEAEVANVHGEPPPWLAVGSAVVARVSPAAIRLLEP
jgi:ABC-type Fe3+/spermidine/putrescine transport system ATPase subunit